jgi:transglutaminase-like putative cysteine protease
VPLQADCADYARPSFIAGRALDGAAIDLMQRMHRDFAYEAQSTDIYTPVAQVLAQRRGVCQDFAHLLLSCLRSLGLPARYVSGYMLSEPPPGQARLQGADASHAWVALYVPPLLAGGQGHWLELDPTNCRHGWGTPGPDYVRLAVGRDFADVSPLRGVLQGGEAHSLQVQVTVEPVLAV